MSISAKAGLLRRQFPRREFARGIGVLIAGQYGVLEGHEIGEGGISFYSHDSLLENTLAVASFQVPGGAFASVIIQVRASNKSKEKGKYIVGCSFQDIQFETKREIRTFVSARS